MSSFSDFNTPNWNIRHDRFWMLWYETIRQFDAVCCYNEIQISDIQLSTNCIIYWWRVTKLGNWVHRIFQFLARKLVYWSSPISLFPNFTQFIAIFRFWGQNWNIRYWSPFIFSSSHFKSQYQISKNVSIGVPENLNKNEHLTGSNFSDCTR